MSFAQFRTVYRLADELAHDPEHVRTVQALTLNASKPLLGLLGRHGLFGSPEWWASVEAGRIPVREVSGVISRVWFAGQDSGGPANTVDFVDDDGVVHQGAIRLNEKRDRSHYVVGRRIRYRYALDELKSGGEPASVTLDVVISAKPVSGAEAS